MTVGSETMIDAEVREVGPRQVGVSEPSGGSPGATITDKAEEVVRGHVTSSLTTGLVPVPAIDLAILGAIQLRMLSRLANLYEVDFAEHRVRSLLGSLVGAGTTHLGAGALCRLVRLAVPGTGWVVGAATSAFAAAASTYAVGRVFIQHFESGGTFLTFDPDRVRAYYAEQFRRGRQAIPGSFAGIKP